MLKSNLLNRTDVKILFPWLCRQSVIVRLPTMAHILKKLPRLLFTLRTYTNPKENEKIKS